MSTNLNPAAIEPRRSYFLPIVLGIIALSGLSFFAIRNGFVARREGVRAAWRQVETVLQRRFDLIPNLVNTVKGYAEHEKDVFEEVARLRSQWTGATSTSERAEIASSFEASLSRLLVVAEAYPDLKANQSFRDLQAELAGTENRVSVERRRYNDAVRDYNTAIDSFPGSVVASMSGFRKEFPYFEAAQGAQEAPKVDFGSGKS